MVCIQWLNGSASWPSKRRLAKFRDSYTLLPDSVKKWENGVDWNGRLFLLPLPTPARCQYSELYRMSHAKVRGIVHFIDETRTYGQKGFRKRMVVLEQEQERFNNLIPVEFLQDSCDTVDELNVGDDVEITYRLSGRKWQKDPSSEVKYFLSAEAQAFQVVSGNGGGSDSGSENAAASGDANSAFQEAADDDDIPF